MHWSVHFHSILRNMSCFILVYFLGVINSTTHEWYVVMYFLFDVTMVLQIVGDFVIDLFQVNRSVYLL